VKPNPIHWYKFNGDLKDSVVPGLNLTAYTNNTGPRWEPGKDGTKPGAIRGFGWLDAKNAFVWPSFTVEFLVWPQSWDGKATGGVNNCESANVFSNSYRAGPGSSTNALTSFPARQFISIKGCPDDARDYGRIEIFWDLDAPSAPPQDRTAQISHSLRSNMWHDVSVVFDGAARKITIIVDGAVASATPVAGPFHNGDPGGNRVFVGLEAMNGYVPGLVDDVKFYGSAVYPAPTAVLPGPAQQHGPTN
jgi:hypothetical protein